MTEYYRPSKHPLGGIIGCRESHRHVMRQAVEKGYKYILILEDDVKFLNHLDLYMLFLAMNIYKQWKHHADILYLGHIPYHFMEATACPLIWRTRSMAAHAYILNTQGYICRKIMQNTWPHEPIDVIFYKYANAFAFTPMVAIQYDNSHSDISENPFMFRILQILLPTVPLWEKVMTCNITHIICIIFLFLIYIKGIAVSR